MGACTRHERRLGDRLLAGSARLNGVRLYGWPTMDRRVPTFAFTVAGHDPGEAATGGRVRVGPCHYNDADEVDRLLQVVGAVSGDSPGCG